MQKMLLRILLEYFKTNYQCFKFEDPEVVKEVKSSEPEFNRNLLKRVGNLSYQYVQ